MPINDQSDTYDRECDRCGHHGMNKTQAPGRDGPQFVFTCPECGSIARDEDTDSGTYVDKR